jgi:hypothetical protein
MIPKGEKGGEHEQKGGQIECGCHVQESVLCGRASSNLPLPTLPVQKNPDCTDRR